MATRRQVLGYEFSAAAVAAMGGALRAAPASAASAPPAVRVRRTTAPKAAGSAVTPDIETRFMHNYRVAAPVTDGREAVAVRNADGGLDLFSPGADGTLWHYRPDPSAESGYRGTSTGAKAAEFDALCDSDGTLVLFVAQGLNLSYLTRSPKSGSWSAPTKINYPLPGGAKDIEKITIGDIGGRFYVGLLVRDAADINMLVYSIWDRSSIVFTAASMASTVRCAWLGADAAGACFAWVDGFAGEIEEYSIASGTVSAVLADAVAYPALGTSATSPPGQAPHVFIVTSDDRRVYEFQPPADKGGTGTWIPRSAGGLTFRQVLATMDADDQTHLFAVSDDDGLFHWQPDGSSATGFDDGTLIATNVSSIVAPLGGGDALDLVALGTGHGTIRHLYRESAGTDWVQDRVEIPKGGKLEEYISYTSDVALYDARGALLVDTPVTISVTGETRLCVNGAVHTATPDRPVQTSTNAAGTLSIAHETPSLATPSIGFAVSSLMPATETIALDQSATVQDRLAGVTGAQLMAAKDAKGAYLVPDAHRNATDTGSVAQAISRCMKLRSGIGPGQRLAGRGRANQGVSLCRGPIREPRPAPPPGYAPWRLTFGTEGIGFTELDPAEADRLTRRLTRELPSARDEHTWLDDIGDFLAGVRDKFIQVVSVTVTAVKGGAKAVVECVIDGLSYVFETIVDTINAVLDLVESIFAKVAVTFEKLFEWIGFLFDWDDILRTKKAVVYTVDQFLGFAESAVGGIKQHLDQAITDLQSQIDTFAKTVTGQFATVDSVGSLAKSAPPGSPEMHAAMANTVVLNALVDNAPAATSVSTSGKRRTPKPDAALKQLEKFAAATQQKPEFTQTQKWFSTLGGGVDKVFDQLFKDLVDLLAKLVSAVLSGVKTAIDALLDEAKSAIAEARTSLNTAWNIPLLSALYKEKISKGADLTTLDIFALLIAVPATVLHKAVHGKAPFPDEAGLAAFRKSFDSASMLQASGLAGPATARLRRTPPLPKETRQFLQDTGSITLGVSGFVAAALDLQTPGTSVLPQVVSWALFGLQAATVAFTYPYFGGTPKNSQVGSLALFSGSVAGLAFSAACLSHRGTLPQLDGDMGALVASLLGVMQFGFAMWASVEQDNVVVYLANLLPTFADMAKFLRFKAIVTQWAGTPLLVLAGIDVVFCQAGAYATAAQPL